jgi:hypothetical protein
MNRYQKIFFRSLLALICLLSIFIVVMLVPGPIVLDVIKAVWPAIMIAMAYLLISLLVYDSQD